MPFNVMLRTALLVFKGLQRLSKTRTGAYFATPLGGCGELSCRNLLALRDAKVFMQSSWLLDGVLNEMFFSVHIVIF